MISTFISIYVSMQRFFEMGEVIIRSGCFNPEGQAIRSQGVGLPLARGKAARHHIFRSAAARAMDPPFTRPPSSLNL